MTIAHVSDTHLGFTAFGRTDERGINQRSADVLRALSAALDAILERDPDLVVHAGDFFHRVSPTNLTIVAAFHRLQDFQERRGHRPFVLIGGNHDTPNSREVGCILRLFSLIDGVWVYYDEAASRDFPDLDVEVLCVPDRAALSGVDLSPQLGRRNSVLVRHGSVREVVPKAEGLPSIADIPVDRWSYVALGDWHDFRTFGENCAYAGATDFCTTDIWAENSPKGWVWFDTERGGPELVPVETRPVRVLPEIDGSQLDVAGVLDAARAAAVWPEDPAPIVRQRVASLHPEVLRSVPRFAFEAEMLARCLFYQLDLRSTRSAAEGGAGERPPAAPLEAEWADHVDRAEIPPNLEKEAVKSCGLDYLKRAKDEADPA